jgi:hypothetical protein
VKVVVFQCPKGALARNRSPRRHRPRRRTILVEAPVSSDRFFQRIADEPPL